MKSGLATLRFVRLFSSRSELPRTVVVCSNGAVASWHPPTNFPYEHSRPIELENKKESTIKSVLSESVKNARVSTFEPKNVDLKDIFYTDKNEWYTRTREERLRSVAAPTPKRK